MSRIVNEPTNALTPEALRKAVLRILPEAGFYKAGQDPADKRVQLWARTVTYRNPDQKVQDKFKTKSAVTVAHKRRNTAY